jgi:hypothetical protein
MQYVQQGLMEKLYDYIERPFIRFPNNKNHAFGMVHFSDPSENQQMALESSVRGHLATLDLKDASDRVSNQLVRTMMRNYPNLFEAVDACRSRTADVSGHGVIRLAKFASMGSALTFPFEAMVFLTCAFIGIGEWLRSPVTPELVNEFRSLVSVYGDDLIVPVESVPHVMQALEAFGAKVNTTKSHWTGKFRESCGADFYDGVDVRPTRIRREIPVERGQVAEIVSWVETRDQFYQAGLWETARHIDELLEDVLTYYPLVSSESPVLGRRSVAFEPIGEKVCPNLHVPLVKGYVVQSRIPVSQVSGVGALMKFFLKRSEEPFFNKKHLQQDGRAENVRIKLGWRNAL